MIEDAVHPHDHSHDFEGTWYHVFLLATEYPGVSSEAGPVFIPQPVTINSNIPKPVTYQEIGDLRETVSVSLKVPASALVYVASTYLGHEPFVDPNRPVVESEPEPKKPELILPVAPSIIVPGRA